MKKFLVILTSIMLLSCHVWGADNYTFSVTVDLDSAPPQLEVEWQEEYGTQVDGKYREWTWIGGRHYTKPAFVDIDNDDDYDMFIGEKNGYIYFYRNDGTPTSPLWTLVTKRYNSIKGVCTSPTFCDIDNDDDYDMFIGEKDGSINFYRNDGTPTMASWTFVTKSYNYIEAAWITPVFCDIDNDDDYDMFIGKEEGGIHFYRNDGTAFSPWWILATENYNSMDIEYNSAPDFCDIDGDGDYDMFIGERDGNIIFYLNDGTPSAPFWILIAEDYESIDVGNNSAPAFCDIDEDGDYDMFIGEEDGGINFWRNMTVVNMVPAIEINCPDPVSEKKVKVHISSNDNSNFISPILYVDDKFIGRKKRLPCEIKWNNTEKFSNGSHVLHVRAYYLPLRRWVVMEKTVEVQTGYSETGYGGGP